MNYLNSFDFSWEDQGYSVLKCYSEDIVTLVNNEIKSIIEFTTNSILDSDETIDTQPLRLAIERYVEKMIGITHDDYNYSIINKLLDEPIKTFIKSILFETKRVDINELLEELPFNQQENFQIILIVANVWHKSCLTYLSYKVNEYMSKFDS